MSNQEEALAAIRSGANVFLSGGAGVGKSWVIHQACDDRSILVAPTGIAALNIGGETCHSTFGLPIGLVTEKDLKSQGKKVPMLFGNNYIKRLIIDEISMLRADYLDLIDTRLRKAKQNDEPFGGLQVICVGDGYQLPPIVAAKEKKHFRRMYRNPYFFSAKVWKEANFVPIVMEKVYRQSDVDQINVLNTIRTGADGWENAVEQLNEWCNAVESHDQLVLCNYRDDADAINEKRYAEVGGDERVYIGTTEGKFRESDAIVDKEIRLKEGVKVMICANDIDGEYKNGQMGEVIKMMDDAVMVELDDDGEMVAIKKANWERIGYSKFGGSITKTVEGKFTQIPLRLGYAITTHKAQGLTLDDVEVNLGRQSFAAHQTYVALSRIRDLKNMRLTRRIEQDDIIVCPKVKKFYESLA